MEPTAETLISLTDRAEARLATLLREQGSGAALVRVVVDGEGGCSGYQYGLQAAEREEDGDLQVSFSEVTLLVDRDSAPLVRGAEIDFVVEGLQSGFKISNPNAATCACGGRHGGGSGDCC